LSPAATATDWAWEQRTGNATQKAVLLFLAREADECRYGPTTRAIAEAVRCTQKTAVDAVRRLRDGGFIEVALGAGTASNIYRLKIADRPPEDRYQPVSEVVATSLPIGRRSSG